jgi:nicotinate-nucleotide pyrophosphorylase (carboxylating)
MTDVGELDPPRHAIAEAVARAIAEDLGVLGDISAALLPADSVTTADFVARAPGVLAGTACATEAYAQLDGRVQVAWSARDGDRLMEGASIGRVEGPTRAVLTGERTALNFLCHLSGVATLTRRFVDTAASAGAARIVETRKTLPGLRALEKAAVRAGGGANHRGSLSDMILIKDNHLRGITIGEAVRQARRSWPGRGVEIECDRADQVDEALAAGADVVMLDNMTPEAAAAIVEAIRRGPSPRTLVEISGGVTLDSVAAFAATGADVISTSVITQSAPALDIGLDLTVD